VALSSFKVSLDTSPVKPEGEGGLFCGQFFIRLRRRSRLRALTPGYSMHFGESRHFGVQARALSVDEYVTRASTLRVLKLVASADFASGG
jgi:hypothetical protein